VAVEVPAGVDGEESTELSAESEVLELTLEVQPEPTVTPVLASHSIADARSESRPLVSVNANLLPVALGMAAMMLVVGLLAVEVVGAPGGGTMGSGAGGRGSGSGTGSGFGVGGSGTGVIENTKRQSGDSIHIYI
jgi:hypothetical protein